MPARSGQNSGRLNTPLLGSITIEDLIVFSKRIINLIVLLCESLSSNTTWNLCFSQFWSFEKTSRCVELLVCRVLYHFVRVLVKKILNRFLFADEVSFALWGSLSRTWAPRGQHPVVKTAGRCKGMKLFGAIEFFSGAFYYREAVGYTLSATALKQLKAQGVPVEMVRALSALKGQRFETEGAFLQAVEQQLGAEPLGQYHALLLKLGEGAGKFNAATYEVFLRQLLERITVPIILIEDGASYHRSQAVEQFRQAHAERLTVHRLPASSPQFNPIEKLWKNTKKEATHLKYFKAFDELRASVLTAFRNYLEDATRGSF